MENIQIATYALGLIFVISFIARFIKYSTMPTHLRWELYPIPGETKRPWGGSYLEENEWWRHPREERSFLGELKFMGQEILYFKEYYHKNRSLWFIVYPFHVGIFLFVIFFGLIFVGALTMVGDVDVSGGSANVWGKILYYLTLVIGVSALVLGTVGCLALFVRKITDTSMKLYTRHIEYFNILFVLAIFVTGLVSWAVADSSFGDAREFVRSLFSFKEIGAADAITSVHILLLGLFLAYLPFTNMMHFFAKHFTFNSVRWDDTPHLRGSKLEQKLQPMGELRVSWSAPHIKGIHCWGDIATGVMGQSARIEGSRHAKDVNKAE